MECSRQRARLRAGHREHPSLYGQGSGTPSGASKQGVKGLRATTCLQTLLQGSPSNPMWSEQSLHLRIRRQAWSRRGLTVSVQLSLRVVVAPAPQRREVESKQQPPSICLSCSLSGGQGQETASEFNSAVRRLAKEVSFDLGQPVGRAGSVRVGVIVSDQTEELGNEYGQNLIAQETNLFRGNGVACCHGNEFLKGSDVHQHKRESPRMLSYHVPARISGPQVHRDWVHPRPTTTAASTTSVSLP